MYTIHVKIKEIYKHNIEIMQALTLITDYKRIFSTKIHSIQNKIKLRKQAREYLTEDFEQQATEFYEGLLGKINTVN